ncbi:MAG: hypothetical protein AAGI23_06215 [Bacteroidota bacterium]
MSDGSSLEHYSATPFQLSILIALYNQWWRIVIWDNGCTLRKADHSKVDG